MTYEAAYDYLIGSYTCGKKHGFDCLKGILRRLGSPQDRLNIIHVAGTNGKGSTCSMLASVLRNAGYKTGVFTSPHLHKFNERFAIDGELITDTELAGYISAVKAASEEFFGGGETLSYFEILTIICFMYFFDKRVDYLVLETGIGGRLDATNIIEKPVLSVITAIGMDHTEYLGGTLEAIAREKGGIIKNNCPAVLYFQCGEVYNVISGICREKSSPLYYAEPCCVMSKDDLDGVSFSASCKYYNYEDVKLRLAGGHQVKNACTVLTVVAALRESGVEISGQAVLSGLYAASWAGRLEIVSRAPLVVLDGAHNYEAALAVCGSMAAYFRGRHVTLIAGVLKDKEYGKIINLLAENAATVILTKPAYGTRAAEPSVLFEALEDKNKPVFQRDSYKDAVKLALEETPEGGAVFCSGSLYLVGDVRQCLKDMLGGS